MTSDQLTPEQRFGSEIFLAPSAVNEIYRTLGRFGWDGGLGTSAHTDPAGGMIGILFTQRMMDSPHPPRIFAFLDPGLRSHGMGRGADFAGDPSSGSHAGNRSHAHVNFFSENPASRPLADTN